MSLFEKFWITKELFGFAFMLAVYGYLLLDSDDRSRLRRVAGAALVVLSLAIAYPTAALAAQIQWSPNDPRSIVVTPIPCDQVPWWMYPVRPDCW